ncbi:MAG TPA: tetratricopeptide repeat protein, partial [Blastocatellia bacterium]|nr:tetratricopeptide repeat protein [Blastocatellia bacterium]
MSSASLVSPCLLALSLIIPSLVSSHSAAFALSTQRSADEGALRALAEAYFLSWPAKDLDGFLGLWMSGSPDLESRKQAMQKFFKDHEQIEVKSPIVQRVTVEGDKAKLRVDVEIDAVEIKTGKPVAGPGLRRLVITCARENDKWRVWSEETAYEDLAKALVATAAEKDRDNLLTGEKDLWSPDLTLAVNRVGIRIASQGLYPEALNAFRIAQRTAEMINDPVGTASALGNIGLIHFNQGSYEPALESIQKSLRLAQAIPDEVVVANSWNNLGLVYQGQGNFSLALESYKKSLEMAETRKDKTSIAIALGNIGNVYNAQGNYRLAAQSYQKSRAYYREDGVKAGEGRILNSLGNIEYYQGNLDLALEFYKESLALKQETGNVVEQSRTMNALGRIYALKGDYQSAEEFHRKSLAINEATNTKGEIAKSFRSLG